MRRGWTKNSIDELAFVGRGKSRHRPRNDPSLYGGEYPFVQTAEIHDADLWITSFKQTYNDTGLAQSKMWAPGTICITNAGENTGDCAILGIRACFPDSIIAVTADESKSDTIFLKYAIDQLKPRLRRVTRGATQDNLSVAKLTAFKFPVPPLEEQKRIGAILRAYGDLIENNRRQIQLLDQAVRLLYKEWFVYLRFPGHEHVNIKDGIPAGWSLQGMMEHPYFEFINENIDSFDGVKRYFATADVSGIYITGEGIDYTFDQKPSRAQKAPVRNSVWFARMQETYKVLAFTEANRAMAEGAMLSSGFAGFRARRSEFLPFLYSLINNERFHEDKDRFCTGATQRSLTNSGLTSMRAIAPSESIVSVFGAIGGSLIDKMLVLQMHNAKLQKARDLLLPRLMSGEVAV